MSSMRTVRWGVGALVISAGFAALQSVIAQDAAESEDLILDVAVNDEQSGDEERREGETPRKRDREEKEQEILERLQREAEQGRGRGRDYGERPSRDGRYGGGMGRYGGEGAGGMKGGEVGGRDGGYGASGGGIFVDPVGRERRLPAQVHFKAATPPRDATYVIHMPGQPGMMHRIREAAAAVTNADDEEATEKQERLEQLLDDYFNEDMQRREEELAKVEQRVKQLRELLERRREKKREIVDLQVQVLLNEADGLGFFSEPHPGGGPHDVLQLRTYPGTGSPYAAPLEPPAPPVPGQPPQPGSAAPPPSVR